MPNWSITRNKLARRWVYLTTAHHVQHGHIGNTCQRPVQLDEPRTRCRVGCGLVSGDRDGDDRPSARHLPNAALIIGRSGATRATTENHLPKSFQHKEERAEPIAKASHDYCSDFAARIMSSGRARTRKSSVRLTQRITPDESTRNSAGRAMSCPFTPAPRCKRSYRRMTSALGSERKV